MLHPMKSFRPRPAVLTMGSTSWSQNLFRNHPLRRFQCRTLCPHPFPPTHQSPRRGLVLPHHPPHPRLRRLLQRLRHRPRRLRRSAPSRWSPRLLRQPLYLRLRQPLRLRLRLRLRQLLRLHLRQPRSRLQRRRKHPPLPRPGAAPLWCRGMQPPCASSDLEAPLVPDPCRRVATSSKRCLVRERPSCHRVTSW